MHTLLQRALISVSDKTGILELCEFLHLQGTELISTGNTAKLLQAHNIPTIEIADYTDYPEMLAGRVKTLHPKIHAGILGRRDIDAQFLASHNIPDIDLVVVNLYPFQETVAKKGSPSEVIENIDIGGPTMIRAAAKNSAWCTVLVAPQQYLALINELKENNNQVSEGFRTQCMRAAFQHTAQYEKAIHDYFNAQENTIFPEKLNLNFERSHILRYGENPHQQAALYIDPKSHHHGIATCTQLQGKALSFNNINDAETALQCVKNFTTPTCVIVKHANPCGVATHSDLTQAYQDAYAGDPESAFGGIIAFNRPVSNTLLETILEQQFVEVLLAPAFEEDFLTIAEHKPNIRLLQFNPENSAVKDISQNPFEIKSVHGGILVQSWDDPTTPDFNIVSSVKPTPQQMQDLHFAWNVCHFVKSNAIVFAKNGKTLGIGAGQSSRIFSTKIAHLRAESANFDLHGAVMASDAFFPFTDNIEFAKELGISAIIQPGGSIRDESILKCADLLGLVMIFTGTRHFKH